MNEQDSLRLQIEALEFQRIRDNEYLIKSRNEARSLAKRLFADYGMPSVDGVLYEEARATCARWDKEI